MQDVKVGWSKLGVVLSAAIALWSIDILLPTPKVVWAAERVVLRYEALRRSLTVEELSTFARTGETSPNLQSYIDRTGRSPDEIRDIFNREATVDAGTLDRLLRTPLGDVALDRVSRGIHTPSRRADRQAMRSALTLSASDDNRISLIEVLENYPTQEVHVDGKELRETFEEISGLQQQVRQIGDFLERLRRL